MGSWLHTALCGSRSVSAFSCLHFRFISFAALKRVVQNILQPSGPSMAFEETGVFLFRSQRKVERKLVVCNYPAKIVRSVFVTFEATRLFYP